MTFALVRFTPPMPPRLSSGLCAVPFCPLSLKRRRSRVVLPIVAIPLFWDLEEHEKQG